MNKSEKMPVNNLRSLAEAWGLIDSKKNLKYSEVEIAKLVDMKLRQQEQLLQKARRIYVEQRKELNRLKSPELWRFGKFTQAPPEYKAEYMLRMQEKTRI